MSDDQREKVARWLRDIVKLSKMAGVKMSYDVHANELLSLIEEGGERQAGERFGWTVWKGQTCVECPDCAFTMGAGHTDEPNGESYSCPACSQPTEGAEPVAGVTADGIVEWYDMDLPPGGKLFLHPPQEREARDHRAMEKLRDQPGDASLFRLTNGKWCWQPDESGREFNDPADAILTGGDDE
ncbi:MAG TPA: hypothetical protein VM537_37110 [Anaerolineae bacterium]|nr:hypothetical protein [Anaerolineae bacterium]